MRCPACQTENLPDSRFCHICATPIPQDETFLAGVPPEKAAADPGTRTGFVNRVTPAPSPTQTMMTPFEDLTRATLFADRYEVIEEVGKGGMGKVYKVYDRKIKEVIALKLIKPEISFNEKGIERFRNELKFARKISHRHVCRLYDMGEYGMSHFITMEYVEGEDLKHFIRRSGYIATPKAVSIAEQVGEGLREAHRLGVVHRDLKPQNIMIDREGNVRIMDFGLARFAESDGVTGSGVMLGTPEYMSPEQVDLKEVDGRSDLYSLGVVLYEMVTGRVPFTGETPLSVAIKHKNEKAPDSREINPLVPESISRIIRKCLEKDREARYANADELLKDLRRAEDDLPAAAQPAIKAERPKSRSLEIPKPVTLRKVFRLGAILVGLLIIALITVQLLNELGREIKSGIPSPTKTPAGGRPPAESAAGLRSEGRYQSQGKPGSLDQALTSMMLSKDPEVQKNLGKVVEGLKVILPEKGPYVDAWNRTIQNINKQKPLAGPSDPTTAIPVTPRVQDDMQKLLALVSERQAAQKAKEDMSAAKTQALPKLNPETNLMFRLAHYEETNADEAFAKNDYSGSKILYGLLEKIYGLCPKSATDRQCVETLTVFVAGLKKTIDQSGAAKTDAWLYEYAQETEKQSAAFVGKNDLENAGGSYLRAAFLYEKLRDAAAQAKS